MLSARGWFQLFTTNKVADGSDTPAQFRIRFAKVVHQLNTMVFEDPVCLARNRDVRKFRPLMPSEFSFQVAIRDDHFRFVVSMSAIFALLLRVLRS